MRTKKHEELKINFATLFYNLTGQTLDEIIEEVLEEAEEREKNNE